MPEKASRHLFCFPDYFEHQGRKLWTTPRTMASATCKHLRLACLRISMQLGRFPVRETGHPRSGQFHAPVQAIAHIFTQLSSLKSTAETRNLQNNTDAGLDTGPKSCHSLALGSSAGKSMSTRTFSSRLQWHYFALFMFTFQFLPHPVNA